MRKKTGQSGQALVAATFGLVALIAATGLAVDMGYLRYQKRLQQSAADSAALAGAAEIRIDSGGITTAARQDSSLNGFTDGVNNVTVTVNHGPASGPNSGKPDYVEVLVSAVQPTFFMKIFGVNSTTVTARAVAVLGGNGARGCLYTLGPAGGITTNGTASIEAPDCGIIDNSDLRKNGSGHISAGSIGVVGSVTNNGPGAITPTPVAGIVPAADPLAYLTPPAIPGCMAPGTGTISGNGAAVTLNPGNYCQGIRITGNKNVTLTPGTYVITGNQGIAFNGRGTVTGAGVTVYLSATAGGVTFGGNQTINLSAPTTGTYAGILVYQDSANTNNATLDGTNASSFQGALYFPKAGLTINGAAGSTTAYMIVVAEAISALNGATLNLPANYSSLPGGSPIKDAVLVE